MQGHLCCSAPPSELSDKRQKRADEMKMRRKKQGGADEGKAIQCNVKLRIKILPLIEYMVDLTDRYC